MSYYRTQHTAYNKIVIFDQRRGLLRSNNNEQGWITQLVAKLKFSQDGSILVSYDEDEWLVTIWDYNSTNGYYLKVQEWNIKQELRIHQDNVVGAFRIDVSPCSRYVVVLSNRHVLVRDVQNNGNTIKSMVLPENELGKQITSFNIDGHHSILIRSTNKANKKELIKIWRPRDRVDEDDPDITSHLTTILEQSYK
jgi:WD40 repeat protein